MSHRGAVLITGCSTGIGRATAERLARSGWTVYATARRVESVEDLREVGCRVLPLDVTDEDSMREAVGRVEREEGAVGHLVNNAGYSQSGAVERVPMERARHQFETNFFGLMRMCQLVLPGMRRRGEGRIVNISSMAGRLTFPGGGLYHASKHAVEALSDALRFEVAGFSVRVVVVEPGLIRTRFDDAAVGSMDGGQGGGPYAAFDAAVARTTRDAYLADGPLAPLGGEAPAVARVIQRALAVPEPRARYTVTPSASLFIGLRAVLPDRLWDALLRSQYPTPGS